MDTKYRVRNKEKKSMYLVNFLGRLTWVPWIIVYPRLLWTIENNVEHRSTEDWNIILMQSTWLFDKNGKEIYEGDIIKNLFYGKDRTIVVEKDEDHWGFNISYRLQECIINTDTREVIDNIYKNPGLVN